MEEKRKKRRGRRGVKKRVKRGMEEEDGKKRM